jgi:hypothetical protein
MKRTLIAAISAMALLPASALAQSQTFYDSSGRVAGRSMTDSSGSTTVYDAAGRDSRQIASHPGNPGISLLGVFVLREI